MRAHEDELTAAEIAELGALLADERPQPTERFAAALDARVAERFARRAGTTRRPALRGLRLPAFAVSATAVAIAIAIALQSADLRTGSPGRGTAASTPAPRLSESPAAPKATQPDAADASPALNSLRLYAAGSSPTNARKAERSASVDLGAPADRIDDVAQGVLGVAGTFGGIVDSSTVSSGASDGGAQFALRFPSGRLEAALAALSRLPDARLLARTDDTLDINATFVTIRRRLTAAQAERTGVLRALRAATTEAQTLRLKQRLDALDGTITAIERSQRALNRRIDFSRVAVDVRAERRPAHGAAFTPGRGLHDAGRVLAVTVGVIAIAAAALVPLAVLLACGWPLARALRRRRREQALDAA